MIRDYFVAPTFKQNLLEDLKELVEIDSGTLDVDGVEIAQKWVSKKLSQIGFTVDWLQNPHDKSENADLLVAEFPGQDRTKFITLVCHVDTVFEKNSGFKGFNFDAEKGVASGPGIIDNKGGVVIGIEACRQLIANNDTLPYSLRLVCSPNEETGSQGFHDKFRELSRSSVLVIGLEPALEDGSIITRRKGNTWYNIQVLGRKSHSGRNPHKGLNAAHEWTLMSKELIDINNLSKGVTLNINSIQAGLDKHNITCHKLEAKMDLRFEDHHNAEIARSKISSILLQSRIENSLGEKCRTEIFIADDCPPLESNSETEKFTPSVLDILEKFEGERVDSVLAGGASDCNFFSRPGLVIVDGLGARGFGMHHHSESIFVDCLEKRSSAIAEIIKTFSWQN